MRADDPREEHEEDTWLQVQHGKRKCAYQPQGSSKRPALSGNHGWLQSRWEAVSLS